MSSVVISGDVSGSVTLQAPSAAGTTTLTLPATSGTVLTTASGQWITTGSDIYYNTGNVGIGTASPSVPLDVYSTGSVQGKFIRNNTGSASGGITVGNNSGTFTFYADTALQIYGGATERMRIDSSGYVTNGANGNSAGLVQGYQYYRLNSAVAGANATGAQNIFGVGVTLVGSTVYEFEIAFALSKSAGTTSHNITLSFGGTATLNNIGFFISGQGGAGIGNSVGSFGAGNINGIGFATSSSIQVVTACVTAANGLPYLLKGTVSVNAGGTFIPQYTLSAAPGGAYTTQIGSYVKIAPLSASGSNTSIGTWA
jgi:hypothetical protein